MRASSNQQNMEEEGHGNHTFLLPLTSGVPRPLSLYSGHSAVTDVKGGFPGNNPCDSEFCVGKVYCGGVSGAGPVRA